MDDATIIIKQNRCFKEVIKELSEYEEASGAKVNYNKTNGLWTGSWKNRRISPMDIKWTSKNLEKLGIFFGNYNPDVATFDKIIPKLNNRLAYWKQFKISKVGKARVVEIFLASKLNYATKFYAIPTKNVQENLQKSICEYINYPQKAKTISQQEMCKTLHLGGIKLLNVEIKSQTSKVKWLTEIVSDINLKLYLEIFTTLIGTQDGKVSGKDLMFLEKQYYRRHLKTKSRFYKEALLGMASFQTTKGIPNIDAWDREHIFYNPLFRTTPEEDEDEGRTLIPTKYCKAKEVYTFEQLLQEKQNELQTNPFDKKLIEILDKIQIQPFARKSDTLTKRNGGQELKFTEITQKILYEEALFGRGRDHSSQLKWIDQLNIPIQWEDVWNAVHNFLSSNQTKTVIWEQIHHLLHSIFLQ